MKIYVQPQQQLSRAMNRVANALTIYAPDNITVVSDPSKADIQVLHVAEHGEVALSKLKAPRYVQIQYCYKTAIKTLDDVTFLHTMMRNATMVWSYLGDVKSEMENNNGRFYYSPLGVDNVFVKQGKKKETKDRDIWAMTSGTVSGLRAEAISEVANVCRDLKKLVVHLGPQIDLISSYWFSVDQITDQQLAYIYNKSKWVSGLRHIEGFEFPVIEGLVCGVRPIVFDIPDMRHWYGDHVVYVKDCGGAELEGVLGEILMNEPNPVSMKERKEVEMKFKWEPIVEGFYQKLEGCGI